MIIDLVIPTKNRREKLLKCLNSILISVKEIDINLYIYFQYKTNRDYIKDMVGDIPNIHLELSGNYRVPDFWNKFYKETKSDAVCYINDDIEFLPDTMKNIIDEYIIAFSDYDGLMGICQTNLPSGQALESAFGVIGMKYADRFPDRQVYCPDYDRFCGDYEMWQYAKSINKFYFSEKSKIIHHHPCTDRRLEDETHLEVRKWLIGDKQTFHKRQSKNLLWGKDLTLISKE